jgi:hypothetical protein
MRVDVTKREVGSFFGGKPSAACSIACPVCAKPGLLIKQTIRDGRRVKHVAHGFKIELDSKNDPKVVWDEPCIEAPALEVAS